MKKSFLLLLLILNTLTIAKSQSLSWVSFEYLSDSLRIQKKPLMIFIHTDWCKYCKMQENTVFKDPKISKQLNNLFYCLKLNAESQEVIKFLGRNYQFQPSGAGTGNHQLAELLGKENGELSFPTTVILNSNVQIIARFKGLVDQDTFQKIIAQIQKPK